jgi:diguanylate cyclase (GGDEF)-like protein
MDRTRTAAQNARDVSVGTFGAAAAVGIFAVVFASSAPAVLPLVIFVSLVVISANVVLKLPSRVGIDPGLILVLAAVVALDHRGEIIGAMAVAASGALLFKAFRARRGTAIAYNLGQLALSASAAALVFQTIGTSLPEPVAYPLTVLAYLVCNAALVVNFAAIRSGTSRWSVLNGLWATLINCFVFGLVGMLIGKLYVYAGPWSLLAVLAPIIVARTVFVSIVGFRQAYNRLEVLYGFTRHLERIREEPDAAVQMLAELRTLVAVGTAEIVVLIDAGWRRTSLSGSEAIPSITQGPGQPPEIAGVAEGPRLVLDQVMADPLTVDLIRRGLSPAMVAPLRSEAQLIGAIVVSHPEDDRALGNDDLKLLETLANHAAASLENSRLLDQLRFDSDHDGLTGLPNRKRFTELMTALPLPSAILLVDLDHFKDINDTLGHAHGDLLLQAVAGRISAELGRRGIVARLGGDEFGVLLPSTRASDATRDAVALLGALEQPFDVEDLHLEITASIGVAVAASPSDDTDRLLLQADVAMYSAKAAHSGWELYSSERDHNSRRRLGLASELRVALDAGDLLVHYQPKASLRDSRVVGVEALVRWDHPQWGLLPPDDFIPVAEQAGLIRPLTMRVLAVAARQHRRLREMGFELDMAVNLSVRSVLDVNLPDQVAEVLAEFGMPAGSLTLEITETSVMADPARTIGVLGRLAGLGVSISIDDFGTGYSSLSYLKRLPAKEVKIDRSFVAGMLSTPSDLAIVRSTVDLARNLGLQTVAEGVEDPRTWSALTEIGCHQAQGFYLSPPLPAAELQAWLLDRDRLSDRLR